MSLANEASLLLIPSGYRSGEVYSVFPTDGDGDFTFSRSGNASRVNPGGYIETVGTNIPRLDHTGGGCPSLLLEPQRTNLQIRSEEFNNSAWIKSYVTITQNNTISPENVLNADKMQRTTTTRQSYVADFLNIGYGSKTVSVSIFIKKGIGDFFTFRAQQSSSVRVDLIFKYSTKEIISYQGFGGWIAENSKFDELSNDWFRLNITFTTSGSSSSLITYFSSRSSSGVVSDADINANSNCYLWGAQTEISPYTSSYIKTTSGSVTRQKDICINGGDADLFNSVEGVIYAEFKNHTELGSFRQINLKLNSTNRIYISKRLENADLEFRMENPLGNKRYVFAQNTSNDYLKVAFRYGPNNFAVFINGVNKNVFTSGSTFAEGTLTTLEFASPLSDQNFYGKVKDLRIYNEPLTNQQLTELTTL